MTGQNHSSIQIVHGLDDGIPVIVSRPGRKTADTKAPSGKSDQPPIGPWRRMTECVWSQSRCREDATTGYGSRLTKAFAVTSQKQR